MVLPRSPTKYVKGFMNHELWSDKQTNKQTDKQRLQLYILRIWLVLGEKWNQVQCSWNSFSKLRENRFRRLFKYYKIRNRNHSLLTSSYKCRNRRWLKYISYNFTIVDGRIGWIEGINVFILQSDTYRSFSWLMFKNTIKSKVSAIYSETHKTVEY